MRKHVVLALPHANASEDVDDEYSPVWMNALSYNSLRMLEMLLLLVLEFHNEIIYHLVSLGVVDDHGLVVVLFTRHAGKGECTTSANFDGICLVVAEVHALAIGNFEDCPSLRA